MLTTSGLTILFIDVTSGKTLNSNSCSLETQKTTRQVLIRKNTIKAYHEGTDQQGFYSLEQYQKTHALEKHASKG